MRMVKRSAGQSLTGPSIWQLVRSTTVHCIRQQIGGDPEVPAHRRDLRGISELEGDPPQPRELADGAIRQITSSRRRRNTRRVPSAIPDHEPAQYADPPCLHACGMFPPPPRRFAAHQPVESRLSTPTSVPQPAALPASRAPEHAFVVDILRNSTTTRTWRPAFSARPKKSGRCFDYFFGQLFPYVSR
jgi:hypothetical protein